MRVTSIFRSIQGESTYQGYPCTFIRLTGCNLRCSYCDTPYAYEGGETLSVPEILDKLTLYPPGLVEITGGEPLEQPEEVNRLCGELLKSGATVLIETNGSRDISRLPGGVIRIMDIKCPGSGMHQRNLFSNFNYLRPQDQIKFVVADRNDFDWSVRLIKEHNLIRKAVILFSAVTGRVGPEELAEWILATGLMLRMQVQLHKYIWPHPDKEV